MRTCPRRSLLLPLLAGLALLASSAHAQSGQLRGRITDAAGEPVIGASVQIVGTAQGAAADLDGEYLILRALPGTVSVRISSVGYQTQTTENVRVASNQTTTLDVTLQEEGAEGEEIVVTAERPLVDVGQTSSLATIGREEIDLLPVQEIADIVNLQAGVVDGHFRGGRLGEVQYQVDGVSVNNPYDNQSVIELDRSVLQEVQVISGTFDAEYGQALSGVVNAVLRSGDDDRYEVSGEVFLGDYLSPGNDSADVVTTFEGVQRVARFPFVGEVDPTQILNAQLSLSGPVPLVPRTTFLVNGQRNVDDGYLAGVRRFVPTDSSNFSQNVFNPSGDGAVVALGFDRRWNALGKLTNRSLADLLVSYQVLANYIERQGYNHGFRFNPDGVRTNRQTAIVHGLDVTHLVSERVFYEVGLRQNYFDYADYLFEDVRDPRYFEAGAPQGTINYEQGAAVQGVDLTRFVQRTNAYVVKGAVTAQATNVHLLKAGVEAQTARIEFGVPGAIRPVVIDGVQQLGVVEDTLGAEVIDYDPVQAAAFVQDRIEWGDLRVRAGLRLEYFDANATVPSDLQNPANSIEGAPESPPRATTPKLALAPRLGVSFPILDRASLFFSYGHFYQMPGLREIFSNADYSVLEDLQAGAVSYGVLGNPDLNPEFTSQYEFGFKSEITRFFGLDVSLFYKDIRDLLGVEFIETYTAAEYARFTNVDFGGVRGFTVALDQRGLGPVATTLDYTFQNALGNASDPRETANRAAAGGDPRPRQVPFNWDQRHTLNATATWARPDDFNVTLILRLATGQPYTPALSSGFGSELEPNSGRKPGLFTTDLRAEKVFALGGLRLTTFARVLNLFDRHYQNGFVFSDTGSPFYTLDPQQQRNPDPGRFAAPRRVEVGLSFRGFAPVRQRADG